MAASPLAHYGLASLLPPVVTVVLAIWSRKIYVALFMFVLLGWTVMSDYAPFVGFVKAIEAMVDVCADADNVRVLTFSLLIGALISFTQVSGGVRGLLRWAEGLGLTHRPKLLQLFTMLLSTTIFIESWFGLLVSGAVARPLFDKTRISREKLAYLLDATCSPKCILFALNAWGAYVVTLLVAQGFKEPVGTFLSSIPFNFYAWASIGVALVVVLFDWNIGPMKQAEKRIREGGPLVREGSKPMVNETLTELGPKDGIPLRALNMVLPLLVMVLAVPVVLLITGKGDLVKGSGSHALFWACLASLAIGALLYRVQGIATFGELGETLHKGVAGLIPLVMLLVLAFTIGRTARALGTGVYVAQLAKASLPRFAIPGVVFLLGCFIAFSTGTSWGTFAIMIPIVSPMIRMLGLHQGLLIGSALGGGIFGDHCSPISDSTIIASTTSATDHVDHVRTQLPYALVSATIALTLILSFGAVL
jgi:tetracycline resistance efflux pump